MVAHNCHGKNKIPHSKTENLTAKTKPHGKTKTLMAKTKYLTTKPKTSRQNQRPHGKTKYFTAKTMLTAKANTHGKTKAILFLLWSIWFCRDVFVFAVRFLVLQWQLWATIPICHWPSPIMHLICLQKFCIAFVFHFSWVFTAIPREIENNAYAKFWGANKVHWETCASGVLNEEFIEWPNRTLAWTCVVRHRISAR